MIEKHLPAFRREKQDNGTTSVGVDGRQYTSVDRRYKCWMLNGVPVDKPTEQRHEIHHAPRLLLMGAI
jgi:hypothetical protein